MGEPRNIESLSTFELYKNTITFEFMMALYAKMEEKGISLEELAAKLGKTEKYVEKKFNDPGKLSLDTMVPWAAALGLKVSVVPYDDQDPSFEKMPVYSGMFAGIWETIGRPHIFEELEAIKCSCKSCSKCKEALED